MPLADLPQTNRMHAVPQNIMDVEFKLIGDLTLRQFIYLFVFGGAAYLTAVTVVGLFKWPGVIFFAFLGIGLAFVPVQERGLDEWIVNFVKSVYSPTQRIWRREPTVPSAFMYDNLAVVRQELITLAPTSSRRRLEEYLEYKVIDGTEDPLDIPEREYILKVRNAFGDSAPARSGVVGLLEPNLPASYPSSAGYGPSNYIPPQPSEPPTPEEPTKQEYQKPQEYSQPEIASPPQQSQSSPVASAPPVQPVTQSTTPQPQRSSEIRKGSSRPHRKHPSIGLSPMTPDMHSGRRFINLVPGSGELVLPIRGERVIRSSDEMEVEEDIRDRAAKLNDLLNRIKRDTGITTKDKPVIQQSYTSNQPVAAPTPSVTQPTIPINQNYVAQTEAPRIPDTAVPDIVIRQEAQNMAQELKSQQDRIALEITKLESKKIASQKEASEKDAKLQELKVEKEKTQFDYEALQRQISDLQDKFKQKLSVTPPPAPKPVNYGYGGTPVSDSKPNSIMGTVKTKEGNVKEGILLIVKNEKGEAVRAVKTNALGQFRLTTPVANGKYTIEVASQDTGSTFDIISVEAKGVVIPQVEINGK